MPASLQLGPFTLSSATIVWMAVVLAAMFVGNRLAKKQGLQLENTFYRILLVAVVAARLPLLWTYWDSYRTSVWRMLDIRDGGLHAGAGMLAAWLCVLVLAWCQPLQRRALLGAMLTASVVWLVALAANHWGNTNTQVLPELGVVNVQGQTASLAQWRGKPTVVNLWASWCPPCRREMPAFVAVAQKYPNANVVLLNQGEDVATVANYLQQQNLSTTHVWLDPSRAIGAHFGQQALPTTLFFDAQGRLVTIRVGELSEATLQAQLAPLLQAAP